MSRSWCAVLAVAVLTVGARVRAEDAPPLDGGPAMTETEAGEALQPPRAGPGPGAVGELGEAAATSPSTIDGPAVTGEGRVLRPYLRPPMSGDRRRERRPGQGVLPRALPYRHDGLYVRWALGAGLLRDRLRGELEGYTFLHEGGRRGGLTAGAGATELAIGATVGRGFVVGLGAYTLLAPAPRARSTAANDYEFELEQLALVAPFLDYYPRPDLGWHLQGAFGVAALTVGDAVGPDGASRSVQDHVAVGPGFLLGGGHEWWVGERFSAGGLLRVTYGWGAGTGFDGGRFTHRETGVAALFGVTYH